MGCPSMQRVPKPGASRSEFNNFCILASLGASSLTQRQRYSQTTHLLQWYCIYTCIWCVPDKGDLVLVHPGLQLQTGVLSKRGDNKTEDQCNADKHSRKNNLKKQMCWKFLWWIKTKTEQKTWGNSSLPERRTPSLSAEHTESVSTSKPQTAAASDSSSSPDTSLCHQCISASPSPVTLTGHIVKYISHD